MRMAKHPNWKRIVLELEINGRVETSRIAHTSTFDKYLKDLRAIGESQRLPWAIFIIKTKEEIGEGSGYKVNQEQFKP